MQGMRYYRHNELKIQLIRARFSPLDVLVCGATGVGKSFTLNALLAESAAPCADGPQCCTQAITPYQLNDYLRVWDSPGLGDGVEQDKRHMHSIHQALQETCVISGTPCHLLDMALVLLDARSRDLHTPLTLIKEVLMQHLDASRIVVGINQADIALCGRHWDHHQARPQDTLQKALVEKTCAYWERLVRDTGMELAKPVVFSALHHFNMEALMDVIIQHIPDGPRP